MARRTAVLLAAVAGWSRSRTARSPPRTPRPKPYRLRRRDRRPRRRQRRGRQRAVHLLALGGAGRARRLLPGLASVIPAETNPNHTAMMTGACRGSRASSPTRSRSTRRWRTRTAAGDRARSTSRDAPTTTSGESPTCPQAETIFEAVAPPARAAAPDDRGRHGQAEARADLRRQLPGAARRRPHLGAVRRPARGRLLLRGRSDQPGDRLRADRRDRDGRGDRAPSTEGVTGAGEHCGRASRSSNLPQVDSAGHAFGRGPVYDVAVGMADDEIERLVATPAGRRGSGSAAS